MTISTNTGVKPHDLIFHRTNNSLKTQSGNKTTNTAKNNSYFGKVLKVLKECNLQFFLFLYKIKIGKILPYLKVNIIIKIKVHHFSLLRTLTMKAVFIQTVTACRPSVDGNNEAHCSLAHAHVDIFLNRFFECKIHQ